MRPRVAFISQLGNPGSYDPDIFCRVQGGDDEVLAFEALLKSLRLLDRIEYFGIHAHRGESLAGINDRADAVILGGSFASVRDMFSWQLTLLAWLEEWRNIGRPLFGICGGHQLMSLALGGSVGSSPQGPTVGSLPLELTDAGRQHYLFRGFTEDSRFLFANSDRVETIPGATVLATRPGLPAAAIDHEGDWVSVQFHPEMTCDRMASCWLTLDPSRAQEYSFVVGAERMIKNFLEGAGVVP